MNKKIKFAISVAVSAMILGLLSAAVVNSEFRAGRNMEILVNMFRDLTLFYVDEPDPDELLTNAAAGMVASLDPYTEYFSEEQAAGFEVMTTGKYGGIGSLIRQRGEYVVFAEPYKDSPADRAGIQIGDKLLEIEGADARGMSTSQISSLLKGDPGTTIRIKIEKLHGGHIQQLKIRREIINVPAIPYYGMLNDSVGYIQHSDFTIDCSNDMRNAIMSLKTEGAKSLVIDYRGNGGGILQEAVRIVSFFVPRGTEVVSMRGRMEETNATFLTQSDPIDTEIPLVILTGPSSASAAEIVAGALQDLDRAVLVGKRTFGKGLVQTTRQMSENSFLKLTTAKYYLPSGRCIQAIDYARRDEDGGLSNIPDSLIHEFHTAGGRKVYDGGGVVPDITTEPEYASRFAIVVYAKGYIADFADQYSQHHAGTEIVPGEFSLTDRDYRDFVEFMADKDIEWQSETKAALKTLKEKAHRERYLADIQESIAAIENGLRDDKQANLELYRDELSQLLENEIILRRNYSAGVTRHNIGKDSDVAAAAKVLADRTRYEEILTGLNEK